MTAAPTAIWKSVDFNNTFSWKTATSGTRYRQRQITMGLTNGNSTIRYARLEQSSDFNSATLKFGTTDPPTSNMITLSLSHPTVTFDSSVSFPSSQNWAGSFPSSSSPSSIVPGRDVYKKPSNVTGSVPGGTPNTYRYILFTINNVKYMIYF